MDTPASQLIDALGGTSAVARMTEAPTSTVHSWRRNGIPKSRLAHLRLAAQQARPDVDLNSLSAAPASPDSTAICPRCEDRVEDPRTFSCSSVHCPIRHRSAA